MSLPEPAEVAARCPRCSARLPPRGRWCSLCLAEPPGDPVRAAVDPPVRPEPSPGPVPPAPGLDPAQVARLLTELTAAEAGSGLPRLLQGRRGAAGRVAIAVGGGGAALALLLLVMVVSGRLI